MAYLERGQTPAVGGSNDVLNANALEDAFEPYILQYPALMTNQAGWEVQCLADRLGWVNAVGDANARPLVFASKQAALNYLGTIHQDGAREYRIYPSFMEVAKRRGNGWKVR